MGHLRRFKKKFCKSQGFPTKVTGPVLDKDGKPVVDSKGKEILHTYSVLGRAKVVNKNRKECHEEERIVPD